MKWNYDNIPDQTGRLAIVTGANTGIGFETTRGLAEKGARVILACRNEQRGKEAVARIQALKPSGTVEFSQLDLGNLASVHDFSQRFRKDNASLDLLINNAGVMVPPASKTDDGFELQIGVNYLGHYALTGLLFDLLQKSDGARVVTLSSLAHRGGRIDFDSFDGSKRYKAWREYEQSKLACLMFALELQHRIDAAGGSVKSLAAHPGATKTDLQRHNGLFSFAVKLLSMDPPQGALPTLYAAVEPSAKGGDYIGPDGFYEAMGYPAPALVKKQARDRAVSTRLWKVGEELTGVAFPAFGSVAG